MWRVLRAHRGDRGASAVEFALVFSIILVPLLLGMIQFGWYFYTSQVTASGAREVARRLAVGDCQDGNDAQDLARNVSGFKSLDLAFGPTAAPNSNDLPDPGQVVRVTAVMEGDLLGFFPMPNNGKVTREIDAYVKETEEDTPCP